MMKNWIYAILILGFSGSAIVIRPQSSIFPDVPDWESLPMGHYGTGLGVADINQDGWEDIIVANGNDMQRQSLVVYYNNGDGSYPAVPSWQSGDIDFNGHLAVGDLNADGYPDVAVSVFLGPAGFSQPGWVKVYYNQNGQLEQVPSFHTADSMCTFSCALGDADGDGDLDLAVAGGQPYPYGIGPYLTRGRIYYNRNGFLDSLPGWMSAVNMGALDVDFADMDNNGFLDLIFACHLTPNYIFLSDSMGNVHTTPDWQSQDNSYYANSLTIARIDNNEFPDLIVSDNDQLGGEGKYKGYFFNDIPTGMSQPSWTSALGGYGSAVLAADVTQNGYPDLLAGKWWGQVELYKDTLFSLTVQPVWQSSYASRSVVEAFVLRDINKDGFEQKTYTYTVLHDSIHVITLPGTGIEEFLSVSVNNGPQMAGVDFCIIPGGNWLSFKLPLMNGDQVEVNYLSSRKTDLIVSNWDSQIGNYIFYNRTVLSGVAANDEISGAAEFYVHPNPFNQNCHFEFNLPQRSEVRLVIYNLLGQIVREIVREELPAGRYRYDWRGRDLAGREVASGMYIYQLLQGEQLMSGKLLLVK